MVWWAGVPSVWGLHGDILRHMHEDNGEKEAKDEIFGDRSFCQSNHINNLQIKNAVYVLFNCSIDLLRNAMRVDLEVIESCKRGYFLAPCK